MSKSEPPAPRSGSSGVAQSAPVAAAAPIPATLVGGAPTPANVLFAPLPPGVQSAHLWHGPLPAPADLERYNAIVPDGANRVVTMAEAEARHRREHEDAALASDSRSRLFGQVTAFITALVGLGLATWLALAGHDAVAGIIGGGTLTTIVVALVRRGGAAPK